MYKPSEYLCSRARDQDYRILYDLLPSEFLRRKPKLQICGRLDYRTSGLVLLSQDGMFNYKVSAHGHEKEYHVTTERPMTIDYVKAFASGEIVLRGETKPLLPAKLELLSETEASLCLTEARYHQIIRMFGYMENKVVSLKRVRIGAVNLGDLGPGQWRDLTNEEVEQMLSKPETKMD